MARGKAKKPPPEPSRVQPSRPKKRTSEYTIGDFGGSDYAPTAPAPAPFVVALQKRKRIGDLEQMGKERHELALVASEPSAAIENGQPPASMSFGPNGHGAGWYDERQQIFRCGVGTLDWAAVSEVAPTARTKVRVVHTF